MTDLPRPYTLRESRLKRPFAHAGQSQNRCTAGSVQNFRVMPAKSRYRGCGQRFVNCFLGGKTLGIEQAFIGPATGESNFGFGENPRAKPVIELFSTASIRRASQMSVPTPSIKVKNPSFCSVSCARQLHQLAHSRNRRRQTRKNALTNQKMPYIQLDHFRDRRDSANLS